MIDLTPIMLEHKLIPKPNKFKIYPHFYKSIICYNNNFFVTEDIIYVEQYIRPYTIPDNRSSYTQQGIWHITNDMPISFEKEGIEIRWNEDVFNLK